uniref:G-protein coupled receptors family 1 profile domain-containing protein n=1 Tax=Trichogramma kaykai TaxID=54128 RepID=A0ABD2WI24_9HYME
MWSSSANNTTDFAFCDNELDGFHTGYVAIHGWVALIVCIFGSIANGLNIAVLTRREMTSPTNAILTGLAVADMLVMVEYIPYAFHSYLDKRPRSETFTYSWAVFVLFHSIFAQVFHTISIWLTVMLAIWRYIAVIHAQKSREWCTYKRSIIAIVAAYVICPLICIPIYVTTEVQHRNVTINSSSDNSSSSSSSSSSSVSGGNGSSAGDANTTIYYVQMTESAKHSAAQEVNFWIYSVVIKLIPCVALTILSLPLIRALMEAKKRRKNLTTATMLKMEESINLSEGKKRKRKVSRAMDKERQTDRTTMMLLAVLLLFLSTEFPQGLLGLSSVIFGKVFFNKCYVKLGEAMDILALMNSAINFILYCAMSRQFRTTFHKLFCRWKFLNRWLPVPQQAENNNGHTMNNTVTQVTHV